MARRAAEVKTEIRDLQAQYAALEGRSDPAHEDELRGMDASLEALVAEFSARSQDEQRAKSNRDAMRAIFGGDDSSAPTTDGSTQPAARAGTPTGRAPGTPPATLAARVLADPHFSRWHNDLTAGGTQAFPANVAVTSPMVDISESMLERNAALITGLSSTSGGALVVNERTNILVPAARDELTVTDLLTRMPITSDTAEYVRVTSETNAAAPVLEATTVATGAKPESTAALAVVAAIVETVAHFINITRRAAADASQLTTYINEFLTYGLLQALNSQVINGTGVSPQLQGIDTLSGTQSQAYLTSLLVTTRKARTLVKTVGGATPTAYVMNPLDWEAIDLLQDAEQRYYFGGPMRLGQPMLWGLPVVEDEAVPAGIAFVGQWDMGIIFDREQARIYMTDSHSDYFIRNILTLLAEMRVALGWLRPAAFVEIDLTP